MNYPNFDFIVRIRGLVVWLFHGMIQAVVFLQSVTVDGRKTAVYTSPPEAETITQYLKPY